MIEIFKCKLFEHIVSAYNDGGRWYIQTNKRLVVIK
jgi:hypothetical protein